MKRKLRDRVLALFLSVFVVFSCVPTSVFAELADEGSPDVNPEGTIEEGFVEHEDVNYYLFIDQKTEFGTIVDINEERKYSDVYTEIASIEGLEVPEIPEDELPDFSEEENKEELMAKFMEEYIKSLEVFHKATDEYLCHDEVKLELKIEEGYELDKLTIIELRPEEEPVTGDSEAESESTSSSSEDSGDEYYDEGSSAGSSSDSGDGSDDGSGEDDGYYGDEYFDEYYYGEGYDEYYEDEYYYGEGYDEYIDDEYYEEEYYEDEPVDETTLEEDENKPIEIEYTLDEETNIITFEMPEFDVFVSATFKLKDPSSLLFIDQQIEHGSIEDANAEVKYMDVFNEVEGEEAMLLYKSSEYEVGSEVNLQLFVEEGYELVEMFINKAIVDDEENVSVEYTHDYETNIVSFTMPDFNVEVSASFKEIEVEPEQPIEEPVEEDPLYDCENSGHKYEDVVTPPTCTEKGYTTHTCSVCEDSFIDTEVEETGHSYVEAVTEPTCTEKGYTTHTCSVCEDSYTDNEVESLGHSYIEEVTKQATETETGVKTFTCECGDSYTEEIPLRIPMKSPIKNPAPNVSDMVAGEDDAADVYIRELTTELFYGAESTSDGNVWTADYHDKGHRFSFRINYAISGVDVAPENTIRLTIPKSILTTRDDKRGDHYEMSIPSLAQVEAYLNGTGESIDNDVNFAYYENGEEIVIYNFRELPAGYNGYIELSYYTSETTYHYIDMEEQSPFTCTMTAPMNTMAAEPIIVKINTTAKINSTDKRYPVKYTAWNSSWGDSIKPENAGDYYYLVWTIESSISATQPYIFTLDDTIVGNFDGMEVLGYKFSGQQKFSASNAVGNQTIGGTRYDYVITSIPLNAYSAEGYWEANNTIVATVDPVDQIDKDTTATDVEKWSWAKPMFEGIDGHVSVFKRADGAHRTLCMNNYDIWKGTIHRAPALDFECSEYTRYDLETFNGYNGAEITTNVLNGFKYASWIIGYSYPWTYDTSYNDPYNPEAYGKLPVKYELIDEGLRLTNATNNSDEFSELLTSEDFEFESLGFSWFMTDALFDESEQEFVEKRVEYTENDIIVFYGKFGASDIWTQFATYNIYNGEILFDETYVKKMTRSNIVFQDDVDMVAYKLEATNTHFFTELFTVPHLTLKNSQKVMSYVTDKPTVGILNNNLGNFYCVTEETENLPTNLFATIEDKDIEYARISQRYSDINKDIVSASNIPKKRVFSISWRVMQTETMEWGDGSAREPIPQNGGTFYDLLPAGAVFSKESVDIQIGYNEFLSPTAYKVETIDNYKGTGRTMLIVKISQSADSYTLFYDTIHPWNSIKDYGNDVYNPVAYETGNNSIAKGFADNGGKYFADGTENPNAIKDYVIMAGLNPELENSTAQKFIYAEKQYDIVAITAASSGLMKKVKAEDDLDYSYETVTTINGNYSYQLRYMNSYTSISKNMILFDSLENYDYDTMRTYGTLSDWRGTLQSIDVNQLKSKGIAPVIYYSTISKLDIEENYDITDTAVWNILTDGTDLSTVKAIAIDMTKTTTGEDFVLMPGQSVVATLHMKAPSECPEVENGYAYTYNNIYIQDTVMDMNNMSGQDFLIHQDYTAVKLVVTGAFGIEKVSTETAETKIEGIEFRLFGTSSYGTEVDEIVATDAYGRVYFEDIEMGSYILQEYKSTDDWLLDPTEHYVVVDNEGKVWIDEMEYTEAYITIENAPRIHGDFEFFKKELGDDLTSVINTTFRLEGISDYGTQTLMYVTSKANGSVLFKNIEMGMYKLTEIEANPNYQISNITYTVKVDNFGNVDIVGSDEKDVEGNPVSIESSQWIEENDNKIFIYNAYKFTEIELRKIDEMNNSIFLEGAEFALTGTSDAGSKINMTATSDENGYVAFLKVEPGVYILKETKAPTNVDENGKLGGTMNYELSEIEYVVEVDYLGNVSIDGLEVENETGYFKITNKRAYDKEIVITKIWEDGLTSEERIAQGIIPKLHLTNRDLSKDASFHTHQWNAGEVIAAPTCYETGKNLVACIDCGMTSILSIPCVEHSWEEESTIDSTCAIKGEKGYKCSVEECGATKRESLDLIPHEIENGACLNCELVLAYSNVIMMDEGSAEVSVSIDDYDYENVSQMPYYSKIITFIPKETGSYTFKSTATEEINAFGRLYTENMTSIIFDDDSGGGGQFEITYNCSAGLVYYLAVGGYTNGNAILTIPITISSKT